ncbi:bifunctional RNase H/acid phosphatase [Virgisporangium aurantiacum]|uniref:bifunctional RNase H/acid phosphatase n=1 Tax=Virgisporangium aurantiacum TaxID=175570 RepID=UPI00195221DA
MIVEADGGSRGNPGPAGYGAVVLSVADGSVLAERSAAIGTATNNVAEYGGLIAGLEAALELGATRVDVRMDSQLVVEQMSGRWQIKNPGLRALAARAADHVNKFTSVTFQWIPRERNKRADALANQAMDAAAGIVRAAPGGPAAAADREAELPRPPLAGPESPGRRAARKVAAEAAAHSRPRPPSSWEPRSAAPLRLILIRHGETAFTAERRYSGRGDVPLTERGLAQASAVAARLAGVSLAAVVTSPLERCVRTAELVAGPARAPVIVDADLIECDFGDWEGLTFREVRERWPAELETWLGSTAVSPPGGESLTAVAERVSSAIARLRSGHGTGVVAVVSHVSPLKLILRDALAAGDEFLFRCHLDPAGISTVDMWPDGAVSVRSINETFFLS